MLFSIELPLSDEIAVSTRWRPAPKRRSFPRETHQGPLTPYITGTVCDRQRNSREAKEKSPGPINLIL